MKHEAVAAHVEATYQARRQATEGYNELNQLCVDLRNVGMHELADKVNASMNKLDALFNESIGFVASFMGQHGTDGVDLPD